MKQKKIGIILALALSACAGLAACGEPPADISLSPPERLQITGDILGWDQVENAEDYAVYIENVEYITEKNSYDLSGLDQTKIYNVEVIAYGDGGRSRSEGAEIIYVGKEAPATEGLIIEESTKFYCTVDKPIADENGVCVFPATYNGLPVTSFRASGRDPVALASIKILYLPNCIENYKLKDGTAFQDFPNLEYVYIADGNERYYGAGGGIIDRKENALAVGGLKTVIPETVTKIGDCAFWGRGFESYAFPEHVTEIGQSVFRECTQLKEVILPSRVAEGTEWRNVFFGCKALTEVTIPEGITKLTGVFKQCNLTSVTIPDGVISIDVAFQQCPLTDATIPDSVISIYGAFAGCKNLTEVSIPESVVEMGMAFRACTALRSIRIPKNVENLEFTFGGCLALESITVPGSVKSLKGTFAACISLKSVVLEEGVEELAGYNEFISGQQYYTFQHCISLTDITLPSTLKKIGLKSFEGCMSLKKIVIPENVSKIVGQAFLNCPLEEVYYRGTEEEWANIEIIEFNNETLLSAERYYYSETEPTEEGNYWHYVDGVPTKWA